MKKLLVMCSTKGRPEILREMINSFLATKSEGTHLKIYIQETDPKIVEYKQVAKDYEHFSLNLINIEQNYLKFIFGKEKKTMVEVLNYIYYKNKGYKYYADINDDHVYKTVGWDKILTDAIEEKGGWGIACGADLVNGDWYEFQRPSAVVVSANILKVLGYWIDPCFEHIGCDDFHKHIAKATNLIYLEHVITEHKCFNHVHKRVKDANDEVYDTTAVPIGEQRAVNWGNENKPLLKKLKELAHGK